MECDSVHANIEKRTKNIEIYDPSGWYNAVRMAGSSQNITVEITQNDFLDFQAMQKVFLKDRTKDIEGNNVSWLRARWFQFRKGNLKHFYYKYNRDGECRTLKVTRRKGESSRIHEHNLLPKYSAP